MYICVDFDSLQKNDFRRLQIKYIYWGTGGTKWPLPLHALDRCELYMHQMLQRVQDRQNVNYSTQNNDQHEVLLSLFSVRYTIILEILAVN